VAQQLAQPASDFWSCGSAAANRPLRAVPATTRTRKTTTAAPPSSFVRMRELLNG
jgi:hypothetical protein